MKYIVLFFLILQSGVAMAQPIQSVHLNDYLWKNRLLIFLTDSAENPILEHEKIAMGQLKEEVEERNLIAIVETNADGQLHKKFKATAPFTAILVGKDGGEKWRRTSEFDLADVFREIDAMPMRKNEKSTTNAR